MNQPPVDNVHYDSNTGELIYAYDSSVYWAIYDESTGILTAGTKELTATEFVYELEVSTGKLVQYKVKGRYTDEFIAHLELISNENS